MQLSIVIPAHNEERRLGKMLDAYLPYFLERYSSGVEFIVVANGCSDQTVEVAQNYAARCPQLIVVVEKGAVGKGGAIIRGLAMARGELVGFVDADGATPPEAFHDLVTRLGTAHMIIASRWIKGAIVSPRQPFARRFASRIFNWLVRHLFGAPIHDTQCGAKLMRRDAVAVVLPQLDSLARWAFDVDLIFKFSRAGFTIVETPTIWHDCDGSKLKIFKASTQMLKYIVRLRLLYSPFRWLYVREKKTNIDRCTLP